MQLTVLHPCLFLFLSFSFFKFFIVFSSKCFHERVIPYLVVKCVIPSYSAVIKNLLKPLIYCIPLVFLQSASIFLVVKWIPNLTCMLCKQGNNMAIAISYHPCYVAEVAMLGGLLPCIVSTICENFRLLCFFFKLDVICGSHLRKHHSHVSLFHLTNYIHAEVVSALLSQR